MTYTVADAYSGYVANVAYSGEARYDDYRPAGRAPLVGVAPVPAPLPVVALAPRPAFPVRPAPFRPGPPGPY